MTLLKTQLDMFYDTISQSSPSRMVEENYKQRKTKTRPSTI